ncbi:MAG: hypothetical protein ACJ74G_17975 [Blastocatellia bacterium]
MQLFDDGAVECFINRQPINQGGQHDKVKEGQAEKDGSLVVKKHAEWAMLEGLYAVIKRVTSSNSNLPEQAADETFLIEVGPFLLQPVEKPRPLSPRGSPPRGHRRGQRLGGWSWR